MIMRSMDCFVESHAVSPIEFPSDTDQYRHVAGFFITIAPERRLKFNQLAIGLTGLLDKLRTDIKSLSAIQEGRKIGRGKGNSFQVLCCSLDVGTLTSAKHLLHVDVHPVEPVGQRKLDQFALAAIDSKSTW